MLHIAGQSVFIMPPHTRCDHKDFEQGFERDYQNLQPLINKHFGKDFTVFIVKSDYLMIFRSV